MTAEAGHRGFFLDAVRNLRMLCRENTGREMQDRGDRYREAPRGGTDRQHCRDTNPGKETPLRTYIGDLPDLKTVLARLGLPSSGGIEPANA